MSIVEETVSETLKPETLRQLRAGAALHMDHYGGQRFPVACLEAKGILQRVAALEGPQAGRVFELVDASGAYASACLGAGHPVIKRALSEAVERVGYVSDEVGSLERAKLLDLLFGEEGVLGPEYRGGRYHVSGRNSGSEGLELALRLVVESRVDHGRRTVREGYAERRTILAFEGAWHGWTAGAASLLNRPYFRHGLPEWSREGPYGLDVTHIPFGEPGMLEELFARSGHTLAAVFVEPVQGDAGILVPPAGYLRRLSGLCREHGVILVADEVLTFAKTGRLLAMADEQGPIPADVTVVGKSLGMGVLSTSLVIARRELTVRPIGAVTTSDLRPLTCAVIRRGLEHIVDEGLLERSRVLGAEFRELLRSEIVERFPEVYTEVRGLGYLNGIEVTERVAPAVTALRGRLVEHGVYTESMAGVRRSGGLRRIYPCVRLAPPLITTREDLGRIVEHLRAGTEAFVRHG
ncbi:aminotransferase class III-fold pyridoxal phosphate-dependent enzyme [Longimicrobium sp.]|uniref:aminotransferase class III-fold pyridoxal phosphate-dependent enzyme n=1 Tax=Longimicrobium sp. TaxID=2029185 RepID=UPI002C943EB7|nr:aminotransferase class III-fold pyridoxal phosphate-dependent enzyme [Longimicrobium sp.]HSU16597.1 aminotransferase class III-fold pyridoxal phosphate-dependent enzyme [Longimicrobium sp.]